MNCETQEINYIEPSLIQPSSIEVFPSILLVFKLTVFMPFLNTFIIIFIIIIIIIKSFFIA